VKGRPISSEPTPESTGRQHTRCRANSDQQRIVATTLHKRDDLAACPLDEDEATAALPGTRARWWTSPRMSRRTRRDTLLWRDAETLGSPSAA